MIQSIRWRLQIFHGFLLLMVLTAFAATAWQLRWRDEMRRVDREIQQQAHTILGMLHGGDPGPHQSDNPFLPPPLFADDRPPSPRLRGPRDLESWSSQPGEVGRYYRVWKGPEKRLEAEGGELAAQIEPPDEQDLEPLVPVIGERVIGDRRVRELKQFAPPGILLVVGRTLEPEILNQRALGWKMALAGISVWLVALACGAWITRRALRPIRTISDTAMRMASGQLHERIDVSETESELGQLARVLNNAFTRLQQMFDRQAQFTADAAHELRTPLSIMLAQTQLALARERPAEEYRGTIEGCQRAARRMHELTESLLQLARLDAQAQSMEQNRVDLADVAKNAVDALMPLADEHRVQLLCEFAPAPCFGDSTTLGQVLTNLLGNALHHSPSDGTIRVSTGASEDEVFAAVSDDGPGIAPENLPHLFDRFFRADASRNRNSGGAGLGLAICKAITDAHGGRIDVQSTVGKGSTFTIRLPAGAR